ncbi:MAG: DoxX family protein [uncultured Campylobacterales bacterium]|uniref:DoxX family protein n=1 Tax=uncultured Campylobacterales bacterium TaxID=352960 RepID=A0A6S6SJ75_9BACT|nr:MAG: DoxX family protein [uncultured Campylobacterales bacterium]
MIFDKLDKYSDLGLLILRVGIGIMFICHGYPKILDGVDEWTRLGSNLSHLGINFAPTFMGLSAALAEFVGGVLLVLGLLTRPACIFLCITMTVATVMHISEEHDFKKYSHALEAAILFFSLVFIGPGKYSFDRKFSMH